MSKKHNKHPNNTNPAVSPIRLDEVNTVLRRALAAVSTIAAENNNLKLVNKSMHEDLGKANKEIEAKNINIEILKSKNVELFSEKEFERMRADRNERRYKFFFWILVAIYTVLFVVLNFVVPHFEK